MHQDQLFTANEDIKDQQSRRSNDVLKSLLADPAKKHILLSIRSITVNSTPKLTSWRLRPDLDPSNQQAHKDKWLLFADLLSKIPHLRSFTLKGTDLLSVAMLDALEKYHPRAHLHIRNWIRLQQDEAHASPEEQALARSPNLRSLQVRLWDTAGGIDLRQGALKRIVALSPNLEVLDISEGSSEVMERPITAAERAEESRMRDKFLEDVVPSSNSIRSLSSRGANHVAEFDDVTDMSRLESLQLNDGWGLFSDDLDSHWFGERYPRLRHLALDIGRLRTESVDEGVEVFLHTCTPLESLRITDGAYRIPLSAIKSHGKTLRTLVLHNTEQAGSESRYPISPKEVQELGESCRMLEDVTIDGEKPSAEGSLNEILSALCTFPRLHTIRIYLPLGIAEEADRTPHIFLDEDEVRAEIEGHRANPVKSFEDGSWLEKTWSLLRNEKKRNGSAPLRELHVKVGEWEREMSGGFPAGWVVWEAANRRHFIATPHERDDRPDDISVHIKGTKPYSNVDSHEIRKVPRFIDL